MDSNSCLTCQFRLGASKTALTSMTLKLDLCSAKLKRMFEQRAKATEKLSEMLAGNRVEPGGCIPSGFLDSSDDLSWLDDAFDRLKVEEEDLKAKVEQAQEMMFPCTHRMLRYALSF